MLGRLSCRSLWPAFVATAVLVLAAGGASVAAPRVSASGTPALAAPLPLSVEVRLDRPLARFSPQAALGAGLDGREEGELASIYTPPVLHAMAAAGLGEVSYRLRTELGVQAWHYASGGRFSDAAHGQGYWTGPARPGPGEVAALASYGYELPRRGDTTDQADDGGYSRLDDGSLGTFWKSDPYLDAHYTHEPEDRHPQWAMLDLGGMRAVDALRIAWAAPYARRFAVQRYVGGPDAVALAPGRWVDFPEGRFAGRGGTQTLRLARRPLRVRFVRVLMYSSSHTALPADQRVASIPQPRPASVAAARSTPPSRPVARSPRSDVRDRLGYAIRELYVGTLARAVARGKIHDLVVHAPDKSQTLAYVSSTDSWHRESDLDRAYEQPSFQAVLRSGLTRGAPMLVPVPLLYGTPVGAVAELRYLRALGVRLRGVELGEEPDGQLASPEDYGALYVQFARAIHRAFPRLPLGGPGYATSLPDWAYWPNARGERSWTRRFVGYLRARRALGELSFFAFEWYPFDDVCASPASQLPRASRLLSGVLALQRAEGIPKRLPVYVTEYGYSAYAGQAEAELPGALLDADTAGTLLAHGASAAYVYGLEPGVPIRESTRCDTWGNQMLLLARGPGQAPQPLAAFWAERLLARDWTVPGGRLHTLYETSASAPLVHAYAVRRPDGRVGLLLLNLSPARSYLVRIHLRDGPHRLVLGGPVQEWQLSSATYRWQPHGALGQPSLDLPPAHTAFRRPPARIRLPPYSVTVLTTGIAP